MRQCKHEKKTTTIRSAGSYCVLCCAECETRAANGWKRLEHHTITFYDRYCENEC